MLSGPLQRFLGHINSQFATTIARTKASVHHRFLEEEQPHQNHPPLIVHVADHVSASVLCQLLFLLLHSMYYVDHQPSPAVAPIPTVVVAGWAAVAPTLAPTVVVAALAAVAPTVAQCFSAFVVCLVRAPQFAVGVPTAVPSPAIPKGAAVAILSWMQWQHQQHNKTNTQILNTWQHLHDNNMACTNLRYVSIVMFQAFVFFFLHGQCLLQLFSACMSFPGSSQNHLIPNKTPSQ